MFLSMMSAFAQEESISNIEEYAKRRSHANEKWNISIVTSAYGYYLDEKGILIVQQEEAKIVQRIFGDFLSGWEYRKSLQNCKKNIFQS